MSEEWSWLWRGDCWEFGWQCGRSCEPWARKSLREAQKRRVRMATWFVGLSSHSIRKSRVTTPLTIWNLAHVTGHREFLRVAFVSWHTKKAPKKHQSPKNSNFYEKFWICHRSMACFTNWRNEFLCHGHGGLTNWTKWYSTFLPDLFTS
jgi:hypothetical protein